MSGLLAVARVRLPTTSAPPAIPPVNGARSPLRSRLRLVWGEIRESAPQTFHHARPPYNSRFLQVWRESQLVRQPES